MAITKGKTFATSEQVTAEKLHQLVDSATIDAGAVGNSQLAAGAVTNAKIDSAAAIALSKLSATLGTLVGGSDSNTAEEVTVGTSLTLSSSTLDVATNAITTARILDSAVTAGKLAATLDLSSKTMTLPDSVVGRDQLDQNFISDVPDATVALGDMLLFGDATDSDNIKRASVQSVLSLDASRETAEFDIVAGTIIEVAHGLSEVPTKLRAVAVCQTVDNGYAVGDEVDVFSFTARVNDQSGDSAAFSLYANATNIYLTGSSVIINYLRMPSATLGQRASVDIASWKVKIYY